MNSTDVSVANTDLAIIRRLKIIEFTPSSYSESFQSKGKQGCKTSKFNVNLNNEDSISQDGLYGSFPVIKGKLLKFLEQNSPEFQELDNHIK